MVTSVAEEAAPVFSRERAWSRLLARWSLATAIAYLAPWLAAPFLFATTNKLESDFQELSWAINQPVAFRIVIGLDSLLWIFLAGIFLLLAVVARRQSPVLALFIAACAGGHLFGSAGGYLRLVGTADIATRYLGASADQRAVVLESYRSLHSTTLYLQDFGALFTKAGLTLSAVIAFRMPGFLPRWLAIGFLVQAAIGIVLLDLDVAGLRSSPVYFLLGVPYVLIWVVWGVALAVHFWKGPVFERSVPSP